MSTDRFVRAARSAVLASLFLASSPAAAIELDPAEGGCPAGVAAQRIWAEYFFAGDFDAWETSDEPVRWTIGPNVRCASPDRCLYTVAVGAVEDQRVTAPEISLFSLTDDSLALLSFRHFVQLETSLTGETCFDAARLEATTDGFSPDPEYEQILDQILAGPYDATVSSTFENPLGGNPAWCGTPGTHRFTVLDISSVEDVSGYELRFRVGSDTTTGSQGWYVDSLELVVCPDVLFLATFESGTFGTWDDVVAAP